MPTKLFDIPQPTTNSIILPQSRQGKAQFTVNNVSGRPLHVRARLTPIPDKNADYGKWLKLDGDASVRDFKIADSQLYTALINAPPDGKAGTYTFQLDVWEDSNSDDTLQSSASVNFTVPQQQPPPPIPWKTILLIAVAVLAVIAIIVVIALATRPQPPPITPTSTSTATVTSTRTPTNTPTATPIPVPASIVISNFHVDPANPVAGQTTVHAYVTVANRGGVTSQPFGIIWKPGPGGQRPIAGPLTLAPNETKYLTSDGYVYPNGGPFTAEVDSSSTEMGSNPTFLSTQVNVQSPTATPAPQTFTWLHHAVYHGGNVFGDSGDDVLNSGSSAGPGCVITDVELQLLDHNYSVVSTVPPGQQATAGDISHWTGEITNDPRNTNDYTVHVMWSYASGVADRYQVYYSVTGYTCNAPPDTGP